MLKKERPKNKGPFVNEIPNHYNKCQMKAQLEEKKLENCKEKKN